MEEFIERRLSKNEAYCEFDDGEARNGTGTLCRNSSSDKLDEIFPSSHSLLKGDLDSSSIATILSSSCGHFPDIIEDTNPPPTSSGTDTETLLRLEQVYENERQL